MSNVKYFIYRNQYDDKSGLMISTTREKEIIFCKTCKYCEPKYMDFTGDPYWICNNWVAQVDADGFCYEGDKREDEEVING